MRNRHLGLYAHAALMSLVVFTQRSHARIIYMPANVTLNGNGDITLPLGGETAQFIISEITGSGSCGVIGVEYYSTVAVKPATGDGVAAIDGDAAVLSFGTQIGPSQNFYQAQALMADERMSSGPPPCTPKNYSGYWCNRDQDRLDPCFSIDGYLGLEFEFRGNTYYGWAHFVVAPMASQHPDFAVQLKGYAYETSPGQPIDAGQTSDGPER
jgi:hypothetical protein